MATDRVSVAIDCLFRQESGRLVAALTHVFGIGRLQLAEDVVQEALLRALQTWPFHGIPDQPAGWILSVARNLALDIVRRERRFEEKSAQIAGGQAASLEPARLETGFSEEEIEDDQLRMMFACCHPTLPRDAQVALTLKTLCGFGVPEIAAAFLTSEAAMAKKLVRARQKLREERVVFEVPAGPGLGERLESVRDALYLLFNEGYKASTGDALVRHDLCREAVRLTALLTRHPCGDEPRTHAMMALMLFNVARLETRSGEDGRLLLLADQDRSRWDRDLIRLGILHLSKSGVGNEATVLHYEAGIAASHCLAPDHASTNWSRILELYDGLVRLDSSPVVALNRAVAVARVAGPAAGLAALAPLEVEPALRRFHLLPAVKSDLYERLGRPAEAAEHCRAALELVMAGPERAFLEERLKRLTMG